MSITFLELQCLKIIMASIDSISKNISQKLKERGTQVRSQGSTNCLFGGQAFVEPSVLRDIWRHFTKTTVNKTLSWHHGVSGGVWCGG